MALLLVLISVLSIVAVGQSVFGLLTNLLTTLGWQIF
jgi:hypothetical protein